MKTNKLLSITFLVFSLLLSFHSFGANEEENCIEIETPFSCNTISVSAIPDQSTPFCCFGISITNTDPNTYADLRITPIGNFTFNNINLSNNWSFNNLDPSLIYIFASNGFIPTGTFIPVNLCIEGYPSAPQQVLVEFIDQNGEVTCTKTVSLECQKCIKLDYDELVCTSNGYSFDFDFTNIDDFDIEKLEIDFLSPGGTTVAPTVLTFNPGIAPGQTATNNNFTFTPPSGATSISFSIKATGFENCCVCTSDVINLDLPSCCSNDPCENISVEMNNAFEEDGFCCYSIDIDNPCDENTFRGIKLATLGNYSLRTTSTSPNWELINVTQSEVTWQPIASSGIPIGNFQSKINFCIGGIDPADIPQQIQLSWLGFNNETICDTTLVSECDGNPDDCAIISEPNIFCTSQGNYKMDWFVENVSSFTASTISVINIFTNPVGGNISFTPTTLTNLNLAPNGIQAMPQLDITNMNPGDQIYLQIEMNDAANEMILHSCFTDFIILTMPECPCTEPCLEKSFTTTATDEEGFCCHDIDIEVNCEDMFYGIEFEVLGNAFFKNAISGSGWQTNNISPKKKVWKPRFGAPIPTGPTTDKINFCLGGIADVTDIPQMVVMRWLDANNGVLCTDTLVYECPVKVDGDCIIVKNDTITCLEDGHFEYCFDLENVGNFSGKNIKMHYLHSQPNGGVFNPSIINQVVNFDQGDIITMPCIDITNLNSGDKFCFVISIYDDPNPDTGYNNCCHTDTICVVMPECEPDPCLEPCTEKSFTTTATEEGFCCHDIDIEVNCEDMFYGIEFEVLGNAFFKNAISGPGWQTNNISPKKKVWKPRFGAPIPTGPTTDKINFCLGGIADVTDIPQIVVMRWLDANSGVLCTDTLPVKVDGDCIIVKNDTITCIEDGHFEYCFDLENVGNFSGKNIKMHYLHSQPNGGVFNPSIINQVVNFDLGDVVTMPCVDITNLNSGDKFCFVISVYDDPDPSTGYNNCCHTDTICVVMPECEPDPCDGEICDNVSINLKSNNETGNCCYTLDLDNPCYENMFSGVKLEALGNYSLNTTSTPVTGGWELFDVSLKKATWKPKNGVSIPKGSINDIIHYCIGDINSPADIPQQIKVSWLGMNGETLCDTILVTECEGDGGLNCSLIVEDEIVCTPEGNYTYNWSVQNASNFTATTINIVSAFTNGSGTVSVSPTTLLGTYPTGHVENMPSISVIGGSLGDLLCVRVSLHDSGPNGLFNCCYTDTICIQLPECPPTGCEEPCTKKSFTSTPSNDYCCYDIDINVECEDFFYGIEFETLGSTFFKSATSGAGWQTNNISPKKKVWTPRFGAPINTGSTNGKINFCLDGITAIPQKVVMRWLDAGSNSICTDTLTYNCDSIPNGSCIIVLNDTITCLEDGHFEYCFDLENVGNFAGQNIKMHYLHSQPNGGIFNPTSVNQVVNFNMGNVITMPCIDITNLNSGDKFCYVISVYDDPDPSTGYNNCCHTDTICVTMPECLEPCENVTSQAISNNNEEGCCFDLEITNNYDQYLFREIRVSSINSNAIIGSINNHANWNLTANSNSYSLYPIGIGSIGLGTDIPADFCLSGITGSPQVLKVEWIGDLNGVYGVICADTLYFECPETQDTTCVALLESNIYCDDDEYFFDFHFINNSDIGNSNGYPINGITMQVTTPNTIGLVPSHWNFPAVPISGTSTTLSTQILNALPGTQFCFKLLAHYESEDGIDCCLNDTEYCFTIPECVYSCENNYVQNGEFELGMPTATDEDIKNADDWSGIWSGGSSADFYNTVNPLAIGTNSPLPLNQDNYLGLWCYMTNSNPIWREGAMNELVDTVYEDTGCYNISLKLACLTDLIGTPSLSIYGVPVGATSTGTPSTSIPINENLFSTPAIELGSYLIPSNCDNNFTTLSIDFNSNLLPVGGIDRIFITRSDSIPGGVYLAIDDICFTETACNACDSLDWSSLTFQAIELDTSNNSCNFDIYAVGNGIQAPLDFDSYSISLYNNTSYEYVGLSAWDTTTIQIPDHSTLHIKITAYKKVDGFTCEHDFYLDLECQIGTFTENPSGKLSVRVKPTLTQDEVVVDIESSTTNFVDIQVYDINGRQLYNEQHAEHQIKLSFKDKAPGMYLIRIIDDKGKIAIEKIIKQ